MSVLLVGCGRLGSAIVDGWLKTGAIDPRRLIILTPSEKPAAERARTAGAAINPPQHALGGVDRLVLAVKPAKWRPAAEPLIPHLTSRTAVVSVMAGVKASALAEVFGERPIARAMPTTGVAGGRGVASIWSADDAAREAAAALFASTATVVDLDREDLIDVATAVSGSGQAYVYAFAQALARAGEGAGLDAETATRLARATVLSAGAALESGSRDLAGLIDEVASPGGTTEAGLKALNGSGQLNTAVAAAVQAALDRAKQLG